MKSKLFFWFLSSLLFISCGDDNNDIVLPEDVVNINFDIGLRFGVIQANCTANCVTVFNVANSGVFSANQTLNTPNSFSFFDCPISEEVRFVSQVDNLFEVPRGLRDVVNEVSATNEGINLSEMSEVYFIEYTLQSGEVKNVQFVNGSSTDRQVGIYFNTVIDRLNRLEGLDTSPINCNPELL